MKEEMMSTAAAHGASPIAFGDVVKDRDAARAVWAASGLTYDVLTKRNVSLLREMIDAELRSSGLIENYRVGRYKVWMSAGDKVADIRCSSFYFEDRQAVTFERDGFVGFAGWADDKNVQPILRAFCNWVRANSLHREAIAEKP